MPPLNLLIKPSSGMCSLNCTYCFYHDLMSKREVPSYGFMSEETSRALIRKALAYATGQCSFGFQGGEPTMIGLDFYQTFVELVKEYNHKNLEISYFIQNNGYLLSEEWVRFLADNHFLIGISLDGTIHTHNRYRKNYDGKGSFDQVMDTIGLCNRYKAEYNILTVVNKATAMSVRKVYQFYRRQDFRYLQFIPCLDPLGSEKGKEEYSLLPEEYGRFLCELFDLWYDDYCHGHLISIRNFDNYLGMLKGYPPEACDMRGQCSIQHVVEADGSIYPCDFYVLDQWKLGNIREEEFGGFAAKEQAVKFMELSRNQDGECRSCRYFKLCRGGCRRVREENGQGRNYFCRSYKMFFDHALGRLMKM